MKKSLIILFLLLFAPLMVSADEITVTDYNYDIYFYSSTNFQVIETFKTKTSFKEDSNTEYYIRKLLKSDSLFYGKKEISFNRNISAFYVSSSTDFFIDEDKKDFYELRFGKYDKLLNEEEDYTIKYKGEISGNKLKLYNYYIIDLTPNFDEKIENPSFLITFDKSIKGKNILFSLNKKDYTKELDGLSYEVLSDYIIRGNYSKTIGKDETLSIKVIYQEESISNYKEIIVYSSVGILLLAIIITFLLIIRKKRLH